MPRKRKTDLIPSQRQDDPERHLLYALDNIRAQPQAQSFMTDYKTGR